MNAAKNRRPPAPKRSRLVPAGGFEIVRDGSDVNAVVQPGANGDGVAVHGLIAGSVGSAAPSPMAPG